MQAHTPACTIRAPGICSSNAAAHACMHACMPCSTCSIRMHANSYANLLVPGMHLGDRACVWPARSKCSPILVPTTLYVLHPQHTRLPCMCCTHSTQVTLLSPPAPQSTQRSSHHLHHSAPLPTCTKQHTIDAHLPACTTQHTVNASSLPARTCTPRLQPHHLLPFLHTALPARASKCLSLPAAA
eukprot:350556-Chlamydomonas_euryale.AAC.7